VIAVAKLVRSEAGMTLVELLIAMVVMSIGIVAIVEGYSSGIFTTVRATRSSSAGALADQQMESFRGLTFSAIFTAASPMDARYTGDSAYDATWKCVIGAGQCAPSGTCSSNYCQTTRTATAGGGTYRIDTYVKWKCIVSGSSLSGSVTWPSGPSCTGGASSNRPVKLVTIVIRDGTTPSKMLFRESSTFDQATAG
jgi:prepilin-type N-terminal cleavage/methylation domain-containing protein